MTGRCFHLSFNASSGGADVLRRVLGGTCKMDRSDLLHREGLDAALSVSYCIKDDAISCSRATIELPGA